MLNRDSEIAQIKARLADYPIVALLGARQIGKTTLARAIARMSEPPATLFDLEDPRDRARLDPPMLALEGLRGTVVIDEVQHQPGIFQILRVLADRPDTPARFLVLGSASPRLLRQGSESLAGRISYIELAGLALDEVGAQCWRELWLRGGFPRSFLAASEPASVRWRQDYLRSFAERDLPALGFHLPADTVRRFLSMVAHYHGQFWNSAELGRAFGVSDKTIKGYLDILASTFLVWRLPPWHENLGKRIVKSPKVYLCDSGLVHALMGVGSERDLLGHPKSGASFEGFAIAAIVRRLGARREECWFWATHGGAELDLLVVRGNRRLGFEIKFNDAPRLTPSMRSSVNDLRLERLDVIHAGSQSFSLAERIRAVPISRLDSALESLS